MKRLRISLDSLFILLAIVFTLANPRKVRKSMRGGFYMLKRQQPNIIFVMADDLDVYLNSTSVMRKTERILRDQGVTFTNAFTTSPLCCPSRSSILTGRYAHNHHVNSNNKNCSGPEWIEGAEKETFGKLMQDAGYRTAYLGKYLNNYDGMRIPPGWDNWVGLIRNSRFYNYTLNVNGRLERHRFNYEKDYFTNVITDASVKYFTEQKRKRPAEPIFMVVSMAAPHGPEDAAPEYQKSFEGIKAPRYPNYNRTSLDKHWIIRKTPPLTEVTADFTDILHRKRLQTLLSVDDSIEKLYIMLLKTNQLHNTYFVFSSDHGYHLGQFNQVKGKSQPYEADIRVPLYMRGPKIPGGVEVQDIALNIDLTPTFLDIANKKPPKFIDGTSLMDIAVGSVINRRKRKVLKPIWKDTFLVERGKLRPSSTTTKPKDPPVGRLVFPTAKKLKKTCFTKYHRPPCTASKKYVCYIKNYSWVLEKCSKYSKEQQPATSCSCGDTGKISSISTLPLDKTSEQIDGLLIQLERQFERLKRRIKRHGMRYLQKFAKSDSGEGQMNISEEIKGVPALRPLPAVATSKTHIESLVDRKIAKSERKLNYWRNERKKISENRMLKRTLTRKLTDEMKKRKSGVIKQDRNITDNCTCTVKKRAKKYKKKKAGPRGRDMSCFQMTKSHWKTPPFWEGPSFTACTNSPNSTYWCLRTVNVTHNFLYCEFITGFKEYYDVNKDPYQLTNIIHSIPTDRQSALHKHLIYMKGCQGTRSCFLRSGQTFADRKDMLRKWRRFERKKRHGIFIRAIRRSG